MIWYIIIKNTCYSPCNLTRKYLRFETECSEALTSKINMIQHVDSASWNNNTCSKDTSFCHLTQHCSYYFACGNELYSFCITENFTALLCRFTYDNLKQNIMKIFNLINGTSIDWIRSLFIFFFDLPVLPSYWSQAGRPLRSCSVLCCPSSSF